MASRTPKPEPVVVETICSLCELPWEDHGENPTTSDCIRLLKEQLAQTPTTIWRDRWYPNYWQPLGGNSWSPPSTYPTITCGTSTSTASYDSSIVSPGTLLIEFQRPDDDEDGPEPVPAVP